MKWIPNKATRLKDGVLTVTYKGEVLTIDKLAICAICSEIFRQWRTGAPTCSTKCANTYHQRRWQERRKSDG